MGAVLRLGLIAVIVLGAVNAKADRIRIAVQKTGTLAWELDVIKRHGIDRKLDLIIDTLELASTEAGKMALKGGSVDLILSDWFWVARERSLGDTLVFYPASSALGAVMTAPAQSSIREHARPQGTRSSPSRAGRSTRAGCCCRPALQQDGVDLRKQAAVVYGAPALLSQKTLQGESDATLNYWNFCAELENRGFSRAIAHRGRPARARGEGAARDARLRVRRQLGRRNTVHGRTISRGNTQAKEILAESENEWQRIAPSPPESRDPMRSRSTAIATATASSRRPLAEEEADARALFLRARAARRRRAGRPRARAAARHLLPAGRGMTTFGCG